MEFQQYTNLNETIPAVKKRNVTKSDPTVKRASPESRIFGREISSKVEWNENFVCERKENSEETTPPRENPGRATTEASSGGGVFNDAYSRQLTRGKPYIRSGEEKLDSI